MKYIVLISLSLVSLFTVSCISGQKKQEVVEVDIAPEDPYLCQGYSSSLASQYILPYKIGEEYRLVQGNCTRYSHFGLRRYAYDFGIPMGRDVVAAREGRVLSVDSRHWDHMTWSKRRYKKGVKARGNCVTILHSDGTVGVYYHLFRDSIEVAVGDEVVQGEVIAKSGNSGFTTGPHLHFEVRRSQEDRQTVPITFRNADPGEEYDLVTGNSYSALPLVQRTTASR